VRLALALLLVAGTAHAERYVIRQGQTLEHVAGAYGCSVEALMRANHLQTTLLKPGTEIEIPVCSLRARAQTRRTKRAQESVHVDVSPTDDAAKARAALAVIDGATWTTASVTEPKDDSASVGEPWDGQLVGGEQLPRGDGYRVRRPELAYGAAYVVEHLRHVIGEVRALYPDVHTLAIGDISAPHGGKLAAHRSHQSGLDVDVGFYFTQQPEGYPEHFVDADAGLDLQATWALLTAFARTADLDDGVSIMFLDYAVQKRLYTWAAKRGTPDADLAQLFQYPHGKDAQTGLIRHWPNHADHVHVRFKSRR
jgi:murein endopeptidase